MSALGNARVAFSAAVIGPSLVLVLATVSSVAQARTGAEPAIVAARPRAVDELDLSDGLQSRPDDTRRLEPRCSLRAHRSKPHYAAKPTRSVVRRPHLAPKRSNVSSGGTEYVSKNLPDDKSPDGPLVIPNPWHGARAPREVS
jgi:hypothetical protein